MATALVTGSARRIGKEISIKLSSLGYNIALHYNNSKEEAEKTKLEIEKNKVKCHLLKCDLNNEKEVEELIPSVLNVFTDLNLLVNSASIFKKSLILTTEISLLNETFNINFKAPFILTKMFGQLCKNGNIINIIDTKIVSSNSLYASYTLSKKNLEELTYMSAKEFAPDIRVNGIAPGLILSPEGESEEYLDNLAKNIPLKRKGKICNITRTIEFLLDNDYITGQIIYIDGGQHLK